MFSIDDRVGNVMTTVAVFLMAATILYLARGAFFMLLLSLLLLPICWNLRLRWYNSTRGLVERIAPGRLHRCIWSDYLCWVAWGTNSVPTLRHN